MKPATLPATTLLVVRESEAPSLVRVIQPSRDRKPPRLRTNEDGNVSCMIAPPMIQNGPLNHAGSTHVQTSTLKTRFAGDSMRIGLKRQQHATRSVDVHRETG